MARRSGPTLYEAMSRSAAGSSSTAKPGRRSPGGDADRPSTPVLFTPGSMVRLPVGYVWVLVAGAIIAVVAAFLWGQARGEDAARKELEATWVPRERAAEEIARVREPEADGRKSDAKTPMPAREVTAGPSPRPTPRNASELPPPPPGGVFQAKGATLPSVAAERRESGKHYYQLITTRYGDAVKTAEVVRAAVADLGLDAQVVRGENGRLASVILLPGFERGSLTDAERRNWDQRMRLLRSSVAGKLKFSGEQPFADAFLVLHR